MTDKKILQKSIEKAHKNGYNYPYSNQVTLEFFYIIFTHDFAKAFWGNKKTEIIKAEKLGENKLIISHKLSHCIFNSMQEYVSIDILAWEYHLQQMVLEENPIKYLEKFL